MSDFKEHTSGPTKQALEIATAIIDAGTKVFKADIPGIVRDGVALVVARAIDESSGLPDLLAEVARLKKTTAQLDADNRRLRELLSIDGIVYDEIQAALRGEDKTDGQE